MTFFNKKEEVVEIRLTSFGKTLYSNGDFKPTYYAFYDDDVIYDDAYGCHSGNVDQRILETPRNRIRTHKHGLETTTQRVTLRKAFTPVGGGTAYGPVKPADQTEDEPANPDLPTIVVENIDETVPIEYTNVEQARRRNIHLPIGSSGNFSSYYPAWQSYLLLGDSDSTVPYFYFSDVTGSVIHIPQIDVSKRIFKTMVIEGSDANSSTYGFPLGDGTSVTVKEGEDSEFLLFLEEKNATSDNKNFDVEVYKVEMVDGNETLYPLKFRKQKQYNRIVDGIMLEYDSDQGFEVAPLDDSMVEYFFDLEVDDEIDRAILRRALASGRFANIADLESLISAFGILPDDITASGGPSSEIYGLSLDEIAEMDTDDLDDSTDGIYEEEDNTNECD